MFIETGTAEKMVDEFLVLKTGILTEADFLNQGVGDFNYFIITHVVKENTASLHSLVKGADRLGLLAGRYGLRILAVIVTAAQQGQQSDKQQCGNQSSHLF